MNKKKLLDFYGGINLIAKNNIAIFYKFLYNKNYVAYIYIQ